MMICRMSIVYWQTSLNFGISSPIASLSSSNSSSSSAATISLSECYKCRCSTAGAGHLEAQKLQNFKTETKPKPKPDHKTSGGVDSPDMKKSISEIKVPRQRYIPVSKPDLLDALLSLLRSQELADGSDSLIRHFLLLSSCLDSILHAEHKGILEEMRADFSLAQSMKNKQMVTRRPGRAKKPEKDFIFTDSCENGSMGNYSDNLVGSENAMPFYYYMDLMRIFASYIDNMWRHIDEDSSVSEVATATRFQHSFMKLLDDAQFEELSVRDLMLTSALNTDYLLTLPILVDWKKASESNAIIFRRGYATEKQEGLLIVEKLDYLQSKLLQEVFSLVSKPLRKIGLWINKVLESSIKKKQIQVLVKKAKLWMEESSLFQQSYSYKEQTPYFTSDLDQKLDTDLPIWLAAQRAISRYEGFLSSVGPRGRLLRKFLTWIGLMPSTPETLFELDADNTAASEPYLRPVFLSRISLGDIWRPASRKYCGNDIWRMLTNAVSIIFSESVLQEPAFQELILLYTEETGDNETRSNIEIPSLQLKIYEKIPIPDLPVIFPHKKLSFRVLDAVRLDIATLLGLLAFFINYKFEDILSSPSAILLDVISISALIIYVTRVALGYKQTRDRYQLLVNRTLYEKTIASGFGSVHFLLDASEQQQYKECILAYAILLNAKNGQITCRSSLGEECERFLYDVFEEKVQMPVNKAVDTLKKFGLVTEETVNGKSLLQVLPCSTAYNALKKHWDRLLS